jgi:hypothetical protein
MNTALDFQNHRVRIDERTYDVPQLTPATTVRELLACLLAMQECPWSGLGLEIYLASEEVFPFKPEENLKDRRMFTLFC